VFALTSLILLVGLTAMALADVQTTEPYIVPPPGIGYFNPTTTYATNPDAPGNGDLVQIVHEMDGSDSFARVMIRRSTDNGESWTAFECLQKFVQKGPDRIKWGPSCLFADPDNGMMVLFTQEAYYDNNGLASTWKKRRIVYRISRDNGLTWGDWVNLVQEGADADGVPFEETHWMQGAVYGRNMSTTIGGKVIKLGEDGPNKGKLLVPFQIQQVDDEGKLFMPVWGGYMFSGCLIGTWQDDLSGLTWGCSNHVGVSHKVSSRGVFEPSVAEFPSGKLVMVMRGSNSKLEGVNGVKFVSVSKDHGSTWSDPTPLLFDDLSPALSSSSLLLLIRPAGDKVYFCGVVTDQAPNGNWPRYPVVLCEIDPDTLTLKRDTLQVVVDRHGDDPSGAQYVNHWVYEDPHRKALVVLTPHFKTNIAAPVDRHIVPLSGD